MEINDGMMAQEPIIVGHKANKKSILQRYLRLGLRIVEFDVQALNGKIVVKHGLETGAAGLKRLVMNYGYLLVEGKDPIFKPSTLEEHLRLIGGRVGVWLDLKSKGIEREVVSSALASGAQMVVVSTGFHNMLRFVKESYPQVTAMLGNVDYRPSRPAKEVELASADGISINYHFVDEELVEELHSAGYKVAVWTVNDVSRARWLVELGVDYIITDVPEKVLSILKR